jgi:hypothetical protein
MTHYICSTMSCDVSYVEYIKTAAMVNEKQLTTLPEIGRVVTIKGGANVMDRRDFVTPQGVVTKVTDDELEFLKHDEVFNMHLDSGCLTVMKQDKPIENRVKDMKKGDQSAPLTPAYYKNHPDLPQPYVDRSQTV